jgi:hypothetical protein
MTQFPRKYRHSGLAALAGLALLAVAGCNGSGLPVAGSSPAASAPAGASSSPASASPSGVNPGGVNNPSPAPTSPPNETSGDGSRSAVTGGTAFGGDGPLLSEQGKLGRKLTIVRVYYVLGQTFANAYAKQALAEGSTLLVSLDVHPGGPSYASIAAGHEDAAFTTFWKSMEQAAVSNHLGAIYFCFEHEVDNLNRHQGLGTPAQFDSAWDHLHQLAASEHLNWNVGGRFHWVWILTNPGFRNGLASQFWPGRDDVDVVAVDGYNTGDCRRSPAGTNWVDGTTVVTPPADLFSGAVSFAKAQGGLPVFVAEWGTVPYTRAGLQPSFVRQMQAYVLANPEIAAALYWDGHAGQSGCQYSLGGYPDSLAALAAMGHEASLQGHIEPA